MMTPLRNYEEARALATSMPGLVVLGPQKEVMASNAEAVTILCKKKMIDTSELNIAGRRNVFGQIPAVLWSGKGIACLMED